MDDNKKIQMTSGPDGPKVPLCLLTQDSLDAIHRSFNTACYNQENPTEILQQMLNDTNTLISNRITGGIVTDEQQQDILALKMFSNGIDESIQNRMQVLEHQNLLSLLQHFIVIFAVFYYLPENNNSSHKFKIMVLARYKSVQSELRKILRNAAKGNKTNLYDRVAFKIVLEYPELSEDDSEIELQKFAVALNNCLTQQDKVLRKNFVNWLKKTEAPIFCPPIMNAVRNFMQFYTFEANPELYKNYIKNPKPNGYKSVHSSYKVYAKTSEGKRVFSVFVESHIETYKQFVDNETSPGLSHYFYVEHRDGSTQNCISLEQTTLANLKTFGIITLYNPETNKHEILHDYTGIIDARNLMPRLIGTSDIATTRLVKDLQMR